MPAAAAEWVRVSKTYAHPLFRGRKVEALREVSLRIEPGEAFGLVGPNRAGKTTLVKVLLSLCRPTSGEARGSARRSPTAPPWRRSATSTRTTPSRATSRPPDLLEYYGALTLLPPEVGARARPKLLKRFGLADRGREPIARFSKGMVQRLGLAQALLNEPQLLVLDEPTEGLDLDGRRLLREAVSEVRERGGSVLLVSHVLAEVEPLCDRVGVMTGGRLAHVGPMERVPAPPDQGQDRGRWNRRCSSSRWEERK